MAKVYVIIDGVRHEVKKDVQLVFEDISPFGGPDRTDVRIWAFQDSISPTGEKVPAHVITDWIEDDQVDLTNTKEVGEFSDSLF